MRIHICLEFSVPAHGMRGWQSEREGLLVSPSIMNVSIQISYHAVKAADRRQ